MNFTLTQFSIIDHWQLLVPHTCEVQFDYRRLLLDEGLGLHFTLLDGRCTVSAALDVARATPLSRSVPNLCPEAATNQ